jgi:hypothetical protein
VAFQLYHAIEVSLVNELFFENLIAFDASNPDWHIHAAPELWHHWGTEKNTGHSLQAFHHVLSLHLHIKSI